MGVADTDEAKPGNRTAAARWRRTMLEEIANFSSTGRKQFPQRTDASHREFVVRSMMEPDELSLERHRLDVDVVQLADDLRRPGVREPAELLRDTYLLKQFMPPSIYGGRSALSAVAPASHSRRSGAQRIGQGGPR
jgi:hypothetical protein